MTMEANVAPPSAADSAEAVGRIKDAPSLADKLRTITSEISTIAKTGKNEKHGYSYVKAEDVVRAVRDKFVEHGIVMVIDARNVNHFTDTGGKQFVTTVELEITLVNADRPTHPYGFGDTRTFHWVGAGADIGGEKGLYKAYTGGVKYFLLNLFMVPTGDDPESDTTTVSTETGGSNNPDERAPAPVIPMDRAYSILTAAKEAGLADVPGNGQVALSAVFRAKLATVGVDKIGDLNVDQAEDIEAWLRDEQAKSN